jgi:hypothetical protein
MGVPQGVHQRTPSLFCVLFCKLFPLSNLGVPGARVTAFRDPWLLRRPRPVRALALAGP